MKNKSVIVLEDAITSDGTSLQQEIETTYNHIVSKLGKPNAENDGYKTDAEWLLITPAGVATIYNYKTGKNYNGKEGLPIKDITDWHIGGKKHDVVPFVLKALDINI